MIDEDLLNEFITEAREHLGAVESDILALERDDSDVDPEVVNHLFRALHTIKGSSGFLELPRITAVSHALENLIGRIRDGVLRPEARVIEALLAGIDALNSLIAAPLDESIEVSAQVASIQAILDGRDAAGPSAEPESSAAGRLHPEDLDFAALWREGKFAFECTVDLMVACADRKPAELAAEIRSLGDLIECTADLERLRKPEPERDGRCLCSFLVATVIADEAMLAAGIGTDLLAIRRIGPSGQAESAAAPAATGSAAAAASEPRADGRSGSDTTRSGRESAKTDQTVRIPLQLLDKLMSLASELVLVRNQNTQAVERRDLEHLANINQRLNVVTSDLQAGIMQTRMRPVGTVFAKFSRMVRDLCRRLGKEVDLQIVGADVELDKTIIEAIGDPLTHLVRNAVDHGIEPPAERRAAGKLPMGRIWLRAFHEAGQVNIQIRDDGTGMDPDTIRAAALQKGLLRADQAAALSDQDAFSLVFLPGFSTAKAVTDVSGRGVGMDVVKNAFQELGGSIDLASEKGKGTTITIRLPLTLAIMPTLIVAVEDSYFAIPQINVDEVVWLYGDDVYQAIRKVDEQEVYWLRGKLLPILRLAQLLGIDKTYRLPGCGEKVADRRAQEPDRRGDEQGKERERRSGPRERRLSFLNSVYIVVLRLGNQAFGLLVDTIIDTEEIVVEALHDQLKDCHAYAGAAVLGDGRIAMILDIAALAELGQVRFGKVEHEMVVHRSSGDDRQSILLFDIGGSERFALPLCLITRVEEIRPDLLQIANGREYLDYRGSAIPLVRLERVIPGLASAYHDEVFYVIIPKCDRPVGILAAHIEDTQEISCAVDNRTIHGASIVGSMLIQGRLTIFLDAFAVIEAVEPGWFAKGWRREESQRRFLVVDDSAFYQSLLSSYLRGMGAEVVVAGNGREALEALGREKFDGVLSDLEMPEMNGCDLARRLRQDKALSDLPLIAVSAMDAEPARASAMQAGFDAFCSKFDREALVELLYARVSGAPQR